MKEISLIFLYLISVFVHFSSQNDSEGIYNIGVGIGDITGVGETRLSGHVKPDAFTQGIHIRIFSRAFLAQSIDTGESIVFVSVDLAFFDQALKQEIIKKLAVKFGDTYTTKNVLISSTHTHASHSGFVQYYAQVIESFGFSPRNFEIVRDGVVESITKAHESKIRGRILKNRGLVLDASENRRTGPYNNNPQEERDLYEFNVDKEMTLLRFEDLEGIPIGCVNWFAVHPISLYFRNTLISGDNKGFASLLFENQMNPEDRPGQGKFVAAFASANLGDVKPVPWDYNPRDSNGVFQGLDGEMANVRLTAERQFKVALELFNDRENSTLITGPIQFAHQYVNMTYIETNVTNPDTGEIEIKTSCPGAVGHAFIGLDDPLGAIWDQIRDLIKVPSEKLTECQLPKKIALPTGEMHIPFDWTVNILDTQILRLGNLHLIGVSGEFTTMAGRRMRNAVNSISGQDSVIAGVSNVYSHYVATPEEYDLQDYEGGSTLYGKYTLNVLIDQYSKLVTNMLDGQNIEDGPAPPNYVADGILKSPNQPKVDQLGLGRFYGQVLRQPYPLALAGDRITAGFVSGSLRHGSNRGGTYFVIERQISDDLWEVVRTDSDLDVIIYWDRPNRSVRQSRVEITWYIVPENVTSGLYRIRHFGHYLEAEGAISKPYIGLTNHFRIRASP